MPSFWKHVNIVLKEAEIIIEVLDSRLIEETRNREIENKIKNMGKKLLFVVNKCDLVKKSDMEKSRRTLKPSVFISSRDHLGTTILKKKILELSRGEPVVVGIVGYPNVGKSSLINALSGRRAARTSSESGYTRGLQRIKVDNKITLFDTPGVLPDKEKNIVKHAKMGAVDYAKLKDPETSALDLIAGEMELISKHYQVLGDEPEEILEKIAKKMNKLGKGGTLDLESAGRAILKDWQTGKIK